MTNFEAAIDYVLPNEGGSLVDNKVTGEFSKYGITLKTAAGVGACKPGDRTFIQNLNVQSATEFYHAWIWPAMFDLIRAQSVVAKAFDMVVNMGRTEAITLLQRACLALGCQAIPVDGKLGYWTIGTVNATDPAQLVLEMCAECAKFYRELVDSNPAKYGQFLDEWMKRGEKRPQ